MTLITIFVCLAIIKFTSFNSGNSLARIWHPKYIDFVVRNPAFNKTWLQLLMLLAPPLLIVLLVCHGFMNAGGGYKLVGLIISGVCLWFALGPYALTANQDQQAIGPFLQNISDNLFGILFWFIILGPTAAVAYRFLQQLHNLAQQADSPLAPCLPALSQLLAYADFIPVRLTVLITGLAGDFGRSFSYWLANLLNDAEENQAFLFGGATIALGLDSNDNATLNSEEQAIVLKMIERGLGILLVVVAIFILGGLWL